MRLGTRHRIFTPFFSPSTTLLPYYYPFDPLLHLVPSFLVLHIHIHLHIHSLHCFDLPFFFIIFCVSFRVNFVRAFSFFSLSSADQPTPRPFFIRQTTRLVSPSFFPHPPFVWLSFIYPYTLKPSYLKRGEKGLLSLLVFSYSTFDPMSEPIL